MIRDDLILDRYEPIGVAGTGGFGTVRIAWDPRIQRKVAIKTIKLTALDAARAALPGAQAVAQASTADRWHGALPWNEFLQEREAQDGPVLDAYDGQYSEGEISAQWDNRALEAGGPQPLAPQDDGAEIQARSPNLQITSLAHLPGLDEARTAAMLSDPRIVTVYDFEVRGRTAYLIMEYVEGITLTKLLAEYPEYVTLDMVAAVFDAVAGALSAAHEAGVLHLDIKPDNILINTQGQVKVTDFGLATLADASGAGTTGGGTIGYMPLEQMRREHLDARTDEWSLASIAYEMLTGDNPFRAETLDEAESAIEEAELVLPSLCWENLDDQADDVVFYALDPDREERYESVSDFAEEMDKFLGDAESGAELLSLVVQDALGVDDEEENDVEPEDEEYGQWPDDEGISSSRPRLFGHIGEVLAAAFQLDGEYEGQDAYDDCDDARFVEDDYYEDDPGSGRNDRDCSGMRRDARPSRMSLASRVPDRYAMIAASAFAAVAGGFTTYLALSNMQMIPAVLGSGAPYAIAVASIIVAAIAAIRAHIGALVAFCLLAISLVLCGHPVVGAVLLVATVAWWYAVGHEGMAQANVALSLPILGAVGAGAVAPLLAGASLKPVRALVTILFVLVVAFALGTLGTSSLSGWDALANADFSRADVSGNAIAMATSYATWATAVGWMVASVAFSLIRTRGGSAFFLLGIAAALAAILAGSLVFVSATPQIVMPIVFAAIILIVSFV